MSKLIEGKSINTVYYDAEEVKVDENIVTLKGEAQ